MFSKRLKFPQKRQLLTGKPEGIQGFRAILHDHFIDDHLNHQGIGQGK